MSKQRTAVIYLRWAIQVAAALAVFHVSTTVLVGSVRWVWALGFGNLQVIGAGVQGLQDSQAWRAFALECAGLATAGAALGIWVAHAKIRRRAGLVNNFGKQE